LLKIAKIDSPNNKTVHFLNLNSFYYTVNKATTFAKLEYTETVSYIFPHFDNGLSSITLLKSDPHIPSLEETISNIATLLPFS
jgi:hypothetical protein